MLERSDHICQLHRKGANGYVDVMCVCYLQVDQEQFVVLDNRANPVVPGDPGE